MKTLLVLAACLSLTALAHAQDAPALYSAASGSVVYLQHEIFLKSTDSAKADLWRRLETVVKRPILDTAWPLASGSGFFVDDDGTIVTNRHVLDIGDLKAIRRAAIQATAKALEKFDTDFTTRERSAMKKDFDTMITKGAYSLVAMLGNKELGPVSVLKKSGEKEPDLALVKAVGGPFRAMRLAASSVIGPELVGTEVFSLGYPLGSSLDVMFQERTVTMNRGTVSAFRRTELSLQHSAAISHGNSGGPLVNGEGQVIGVNTAGLQEQEGNSLFYAIDVGEVRDFLVKQGMETLLKWNERLPSIGGSSTGVKLNALGEIECSADVVLDIDKDVDVFLDGAKTGTGPLFVHLVNPVSSLDLSGPKGEFSGKLRLLSTLTGSTTLKPRLSIQPIPVTFTSNPVGARVVADGKDLGVTPVNVSLAEGSYILRFTQEGRWYQDATVVVRKGQANRFDFNGDQCFSVVLSGLPPDAGQTLRFESKLRKAVFKGGENVTLPSDDWSLSIEGNDAFSGVAVPVLVHGGPVTVSLTYPVTVKSVPSDTGATLRFESKPRKASFKPSQEVRLPAGDWTLSIDGSEAFKDVSVPVQVQKEPVVLDLSPFWRSASLRIAGLDAKARLWIDDKPVAFPGTDALQLPVGVHSVYVWEERLLPLEKVEVNVHVDNSSVVTWKHMGGHDVTSAWCGWSGLGTGVLGSALLGLGIYGSQNSVAIAQTSSYQEYTSFRTGATVALVSGCVLLAGTGVLEFLAVTEKNKYEAQRKYLQSLEGR